jgi:hypothetical protein
MTAEATAICSLGKSNTRIHHSFDGTKDTVVAPMRRPAPVATARVTMLSTTLD